MEKSICKTRTKHASNNRIVALAYLETCQIVERVKPGGGGGQGVLLRIPGGGVPPGSPDTDTTEKNKTRKHNRDSSTWKLVRL